jgi:hypothetical protein
MYNTRYNIYVHLLNDVTEIDAIRQANGD